MPGNEKTWSIEPVHIVPHSETESDEHECQFQNSLHQPVSDISQFLIEARNASQQLENVIDI